MKFSYHPSESAMRTTLSALLLFLLPALAFGQVQTFRKEVKQVMGSAMSQDDARVAAIAKAKRDALEEAGTWLEAQSEVRNFNLAKDDVTALASGLVQTRVLEEQPFAESGVLGVRVVVEVRVDNSGLAERVRQFLADRRQQGLVNSKAEARPGTELPDAKELVPVAADCLASGDGDSRQYTARKWYELGQGLWDGKREKYSDVLTAAKFLSRALVVDRGLQAAYLARGRLCLQEGKYENALDAFDQAIKLNPADSDARSYRGRAYASLKKFDLAILDHNQAIQLKPNHAEYYRSRGRTYIQLRQMDLAMADFEKGVQIEPKNPESRRWRAVGFYSANRMDEALADMNLALRLDPANSRLFEFRSTLHSIMGRNGQALSDMNQAIALAHFDDKGLLLFRRGFLQLKSGNRDAAMDDFLSACAQKIEAACDTWHSSRK